MSGYHQDGGSYPADGQYGWSDQGQQGSYNFDMSGSQFGQQQDFQTFENVPQQEANFSPGYAGNTYLNPAGSQANYQGEIFTPLGSATSDSDNFEDEPPLMEELGINPDHIIQKVIRSYLPISFDVLMKT